LNPQYEKERERERERERREEGEKYMSIKMIELWYFAYNELFYIY
jgi:hypothetical protein